MNVAIGIVVFLVVVLAVLGGMFLYKRHGDHIEDAVDKAKDVAADVKDKIEDIRK